MAKKPNDTTTELNLATTDGSSMDESAVEQYDGSTAHRARIALGDDTGELFNAATGDSNQAAIPVSVPGIGELNDTLLRMETLLNLILDKL